MNEKTKKAQKATTVTSLADRYSFGHKALSVVLSVVLLGFGWPAVNPAEVFANSDAAAQSEVAQSQESATGATDAPAVQQAESASSEQNPAATQEAAPAASEQESEASSASQAVATSEPTSSTTQESSSQSAAQSSSAQSPAPEATSQAKSEYDIALNLNNASIKNSDGSDSLISLPSTKITVPANKDFSFTVVPDNGYDLEKVVASVDGTENELSPNNSGVYTIAKESVAKGATITLVTHAQPQASNGSSSSAVAISEIDNADGNELAATYTIKQSDTASQEDTEYEKWISVGESKTIAGTSSGYSGSNWWLDGKDDGVIEFTKNGDSATVKGLKIGTVKLVHGYYKSWWSSSWTTETYTIHVLASQPAKSVSISGDDFVTQFASTQLSAATNPANASGTYTWASSNEDILTVDNNGNVTGVRQGTATVTVTFTSAADGSTVTASKDVKVEATTASTDTAEVYYLLDPTKDANSNDSGNWGPKYGNATVNLNGATWTNGKNCFDNVDQRVVSWPNGTNVVSRDSDAWKQIFENYKSTIQTQLPGVDFTEDDVEEIALVPAKISRNNGTTIDKHLDCNVTIKCKNVSLVKYYLRDAGSTQFEQKGSKNYVSGSTTQPSDVTDEQFPATKVVDGVTYTFSGWYLDQNFTQPATFPYTVNGSTNFYAKYVGGFQVIYDLDGGTWGNSDATMYSAQEGSTQTVKSEPSREGYKFTGWMVEGLPDTTTVNSGDAFTMPASNVTITANWEKLESYVVKYQEVGTEAELAKSETRYGEKGQVYTEHAKAIDGYHLSNCPDAIEHTFGEGDSTVIFWYEKDSVNYTVNYYLNGTDQKVADSETKSAAWDSTVKASGLAKDISGYTVVPDQNETITVKRDGSSTINVYYYQNVDLVANSKTDAIYNGEEQSVSGFTGAPEGADFSAITVGAAGTNAGTYPANFADDTVGTVDATRKYIVGSAQNGELVIKPVTQEVTITITGHKGGEKYNGEEQTVSGYDVSGLPTGVTDKDVAYAGSAEVKAANAGTYQMNLNEKLFSLTGDASKNYIHVTFKVADGELSIGKRQVALESEGDHKNYDGKTLQCRTNLKVSGDGFVGDDGVLAKEKLTWYDENNILPGTYENKFDPAYTEGTNLNNYDVTLKFGELVVNARSDKDKYKILRLLPTLTLRRIAAQSTLFPVCPAPPSPTTRVQPSLLKV